MSDSKKKYIFAVSNLNKGNLDTMKKIEINYSPYFAGKPYVDMTSGAHGLLGVSTDGDMALLCRLELMAGLSFPGEEEFETVTEQRVQAYYDVLYGVLTNNDPVKKSFEIDIQDVNVNGSNDAEYRITRSLLQWRDEMLLAGWDGKSQLPGKLAFLSVAEKQIPSQSPIRLGQADRWCTLTQPQHLQTILAGISAIHSRCPKELVRPRIVQVLNGLKADFPKIPSIVNFSSGKYHILQVPELYQAFEWLATQTVQPSQLVVCQQRDRLDSVLRNFAQPEISRVHSHRVVQHVCDAYDVPQSLIWLDCNGDYGLHYPYEMLTKGEMQELKRQGIVLLPKSDMLTVLDRWLISTLNAVSGDVWLVSAARDNGNPLPQHPLVAKLGITVAPQPLGSLKVALKPQQVCTGFQQQKVYELKQDFSKGNNAVVMSYSTLDQLIQQPFNFVVERELGLWDPVRSDDLHTEQGTVAHLVVEKLVNGGWFSSASTIAANFDSCFDDAVRVKGVLLRKKENQMELVSFRAIVRHSIDVLAQIVDNCHLQPVRCEFEIPSFPLPGFGPNNTAVDFKASIDMLLYDPADGQYVIFDFKFSTSENTHPGKLKENKSVQFAIYERLFNAWADDLKQKGGKVDNRFAPAHVKAYGYYLLPLETLYVPDGAKGSQWLQGAHIKTVAQSNAALSNIQKSLQASYAERMQEFQSGTIDEGAGMEMSGLAYQAAAQNNPDLFPLEHEYQKPNLRADSYTPTHIVLKNQIR